MGTDVQARGRPAHREVRHEIDVHRALFQHFDEVTVSGDNGDEVIQDQHVFAITTYPELEALLEESGLQVEMLLENKGERHRAERLDGPRMVVIARAGSEA